MRHSSWWVWGLYVAIAGMVLVLRLANVLRPDHYYYALVLLTAALLIPRLWTSSRLAAGGLYGCILLQLVLAPILLSFHGNSSTTLVRILIVTLMGLAGLTTSAFIMLVIARTVSEAVGAKDGKAQDIQGPLANIKVALGHLERSVATAGKTIMEVDQNLKAQEKAVKEAQAEVEQYRTQAQVGKKLSELTSPQREEFLRLIRRGRAMNWILAFVSGCLSSLLAGWAWVSWLQPLVSPPARP